MHTFLNAAQFLMGAGVYNVFTTILRKMYLYVPEKLYVELFSYILSDMYFNNVVNLLLHFLDYFIFVFQQTIR
jgi:hypothetical protein